MTHRADQIVAAVRDRIAARVERDGVTVYTHRRYSLDPEQAELPAVSVDYGEDRAAAHTTQYIDSQLTLLITASVAHPLEAELRAKLLELRREIHIALMADVTLGLAFIVVTTYDGADVPEFNTEGEQPFAELTSRWLVYYRMNILDPGDN